MQVSQESLLNKPREVALAPHIMRRSLRKSMPHPTTEMKKASLHSKSIDCAATMSTIDKESQKFNGNKAVVSQLMKQCTESIEFLPPKEH